MRLTRRQILGAASAGALIAACGEPAPPPDERRTAAPEPEPVDGASPWALDPAAVAEDAARFPFGVHAGAMTHAGVRLSTVHDGALVLRVWRERPTGERLLAHERRVEPAGRALELDVPGLGAGWYQYAFFAEDGAFRSPIGRFRTAFAPGDLRPLTVVGLTCTQMRNRTFPAVEQSAALGADLFVHLGDLAYCDGAVTADEYRAKWREVFDEGSYKKAFARAGYYYTWDDHEFANNFDPTKLDPAQLATAKSVVHEILAIEADEQGRIWRSYRWGDTAEFFVLDCRTERDPSSRMGPDARYLSPEQFAWLEAALVASPCRFKIILNSVPMTNFPELWALGEPDRWSGYQAARARLLGHLERNRVTGVVFLSGDYHCSFIAKVEPTGWASRYLDIAVGPSGNGPNPAAVLADAGFTPREEVFPAATFMYGSSVWPATTALRFDPLNDELHARFVDAETNAVLFDAVLPIDLST